MYYVGMRKIIIYSFVLLLLVGAFCMVIPVKASAWASISLNVGVGMNNGYSSYGNYMPVYGGYPYGYNNYGYNNNNYYYGGMGYAPMYSNYGYGNYGYNNYGYNYGNYYNGYGSYCGCW